MKKRLDTSLLVWMNRPSLWTIGRSRIIFSTEPATDFWINQARQLNKFNGHALLLPIRQDFTLTVTIRRARTLSREVGTGDEADSPSAAPASSGGREAR